MNWMENLLIIAGVSLDIFAAMECQGSLVAKINKKNLTVICGIVALAQLITLYLGHFLSSLFCHYRSVPDEKLLGQIISMVIFMILGIRLMVKAIRNEHVEEHLEHHLGIRRFVRMACISGIYTLLTGIAFWISGNECAYDSDHDCCMYRCICDRRHLYRISCRI